MQNISGHCPGVDTGFGREVREYMMYINVDANFLKYPKREASCFHSEFRLVLVKVEKNHKS